MNLKELAHKNKHECKGNNEPIVLVCAADDNYSMPLAVTLRSALENLQNNCKLNVFIIDGGIKKQNKTKILESLNPEKCEVRFISVDESLLSNVEQEVHKYIQEEVITALKHISIAAYYRLLIPELLPPQIEKVIYLDCDLVVRGNLEQLWQNDIGDYYVLAVQDILIRNVGNPLGLLNYKELEIPPNLEYFNSGVLVINVKKWRANKVRIKAIKYLKKNRDFIRYPDQDVLNALFAGQWGKLDYRWNFIIPHALEYSYWQAIQFSVDFYNTLIYDPYIIHFTTERKPWNSRHTQFKEHFFYYVDMTSWSGWRLTFIRRLRIWLARKFQKIINLM